MNWPFGDNFDFLHFLHSEEFAGVFLINFPDLPKSSLAHTKIHPETVERNFLIWLFTIEILSIWLDEVDSLSPWSLLNMILQLFAYAYFVKSFEVDMSE
jgi:hypothetical protein